MHWIYQVQCTGTHPNCLCIFSDLARKLLSDMKCYKFLCVLNGFLGRVRTGYIVTG